MNISPKTYMNRGQQKSTRLRIGMMGLIFVFVFGVIYFFNLIFPLYSDDYLYSFIYGVKPLTRITSFSDIVTSQINHYQMWGGRTIAHTIAQTLLWMDLKWAKFLNSLIFVLYIGLVYKLCNLKNKLNPAILISVFFILWIILPNKYQTILWITGSANYLWGTFFSLLFLYPFYSYYYTMNYKKYPLRWFVFLIGGIIAGWTNENIFIAEIFYLSCILFIIKKKQKIPLWAICGFIGICLGGIIMLLSPGNFIRSNIVNENLGLIDKSLWENILYRVGKTVFRYVVYILPITFIYILVYFLYKKVTNKNNVDKKIIGSSLLFAASAHVAWIVMCASAIFPPRATFYIITLMVIACGIIYANMDLANRTRKKVNLICIVIVGIVFSVEFFNEYKQMKTVSSIMLRREQYIERQRDFGIEYAIFDEKINLPDKYNFEDLSESSTATYNQAYARFHGLDSVRIQTGR